MRNTAMRHRKPNLRSDLVRPSGTFQRKEHTAIQMSQVSLPANQRDGRLYR